MTSQISDSIDEALAIAIAHHQAQRLDEAARAYRDILAQRPYHPLANHNLGMLAWQQGRAAEGLPYLRQAWSVNPDEGQFWLSYAEGLLRAGQPDEARELLMSAQIRGLDSPELHALLERCAIDIVKLAENRPSEGDTHEIARLFSAGEYAGAEATVRELIARYPASGMLWGMLGTILQVQGKEALPALEEAARLAPNDTENLVGLGNAQQQAQRYDEAIATYQRALSLAPGMPEAYCNLGSAYMACNDFENAVDSFNNAIRLNGDYLLAWLNLGNCEVLLHRLDAAATSYRNALTLAPDDPGIANVLADVLEELGQTDEAAHLYRRVLELTPDSALAWLRHANALRNLGNASEAPSAYLRAEELCGQNIEMLTTIGLGLQAAGVSHEAMRVYRRVLALDSDNARANFYLGTILEASHEFEIAYEHYRTAIAADPDLVDAQQNLGNCLRHMGRLDEAMTQYRRVLALQPDRLHTYLNISALLSDQGLLSEAIAHSRAALAIFPADPLITCSLLYCLLHADEVTPEEVKAEHFRFGAHFDTFFEAATDHANDRSPERVIRLGFVSGDFNNHALANFFLPILVCLRTSRNLQLYAYYNNELEDEITADVRRHVDVWRAVPAMSDEALTALIRDDAIDVLIDLSGHTNRNRLAVFARKPAPVQATWIGYPGTTGLKAMDYILHDRHILVPELAPQFTERFAYLPAGAVFQPRPDMPLVNPLPAYKNGYITYGSFNRINKLRRPVIALWSRLLRAQPTARLMLAGMPKDGQYQHLIDWFAEEGVARERLEFQPRTSVGGFLHLHHKVDLCLDTFPYTGGTTTMQSLWMGVPLLTLAGPTLAARTSAGVLQQLNLGAFVAANADDFVERGLAVTARLELLGDLRQNMRAILREAPISRPLVIATAFEGAVRHMWHRWCAGQLPETFEIEYDIVRATSADMLAKPK